MSNELLTTREAAELLRVTIRTVKSYKKNGLITAHHLGKKNLFKKDELINSLTVKNPKSNG